MKLQTVTNKKSEQYIIDGIATNNSKVINEIYAKHSQYIWTFVLKNNGTTEDAKDIFQEAILAIYQKTQQDELKLTCSFRTYLYGICQRLWFKKLRKIKNQPQVRTLDLAKAKSTAFEIETDNEAYILYANLFSKLPKKQQKLLNLYLDGYKMKEIMQKLDLKSEDYTRKLKYKYKEHLKQLIHQDIRFNEFVA
mgnify:CR=1 FL=1